MKSVNITEHMVFQVQILPKRVHGELFDGLLELDTMAARNRLDGNEWC